MMKQFLDSLLNRMSLEEKGEFFYTAWRLLDGEEIEKRLSEKYEAFSYRLFEKGERSKWTGGGTYYRTTDLGHEFFNKLSGMNNRGEICL